LKPVTTSSSSVTSATSSFTPDSQTTSQVEPASCDELSPDNLGGWRVPAEAARAFCEELLELLRFLVVNSTTWREVILQKVNSFLSDPTIPKLIDSSASIPSTRFLFSAKDADSIGRSNALYNFLCALAIFGGHSPAIRIGGKVSIRQTINIAPTFSSSQQIDVVETGTILEYDPASGDITVMPDSKHPELGSYRGKGPVTPESQGSPYFSSYLF
jgi:hypothetical protein